MNLLLARRVPLFAPVRLLSAKQLVYHEHGDPNKVVKLVESDIPDEPQSDEVLVKWRSAPINPADLNQIQGVYPVSPPLPAVGGNEGCGWVEKVGRGVKDLKEGDLVIPSQSGLGTWRTYGIHKGVDLFPIDKDLDRTTAAMFQVNPCTAYRMLHDFVELAPGDIIIQNGANSAVGRYVIQIARLLNLNLINVIRDRPNVEELKAELETIGADSVYTDEEFAKASKVLSNVHLALNCVGGRSSLLLAKTLTNGGCMITYGGMSKKPVECPTSSLIFKDITLRGFWMSEWYAQGPSNADKRHEMYAHLGEWFKTGHLKTTSVDEHKIENFKDTIGKASTKSNVKQLFVFQ
ncbi:PKS-ER domain-containing protein [Aphelenchoides bicaudatus]|nr:PKS-ER domain-containing protein [Aphelenchoides bicaudatus]